MRGGNCGRCKVWGAERSDLGFELGKSLDLSVTAERTWPLVSDREESSALSDTKRFQFEGEEEGKGMDGERTARSVRAMR